MFLYRSVPGFHEFVGAIKADGGDDGPEDIMGGLKTTFSQLSWRTNSSKVVWSKSLFKSNYVIILTCRY